MLKKDFPPAVVKACSILQISPDDLTKKSITDAWKLEITKYVFPEIQEQAVMLNIAKDVLFRWLDERSQMSA